MEETIVVSETPSSSSQLNPPSRIICRVCQKQFSQYTCPRCNSRYCSLQCYKSHSLRCTESFMKENVMEELQQLQPDDETKRKMLNILKRLHSEEETDSMDEDDATLSEETVQKVLSGEQISYDDLSAEEKKRFQRALASGELSKLIKPWEPWWLKPSARTVSLSRDGNQLVQPITKDEIAVLPQDDHSESDQLHDIPPGPETPLPPLSKLSSVEPSPLLAVHLVDIIYSYCFALRLYNGDWRSDSIGSAAVIFSVSSVLGQGAQPETILEAVSHCLEQACSPAFRHVGGFHFGFGVLDDVCALLSLGGSALVCLLSDLHRMIQDAERRLKSEDRRKSKRAEMRSKLKHAERKVFFIMCWVHQQPGEAWASLSAIVETEKSSAVDYLGNGRGNKPEITSGNTGKALIEEIQ